MTRLLQLLSAALLLASSLYASADQTSYVGTDTFTSTGSITFGDAWQAGDSNGIFAPFAGTTASFTSFNFLSYGSGAPLALWTDTEDANVLTYVLSTQGFLYSLVVDASPGATDQFDLTITGTGTYYLNGEPIATGSLNLSTQGRSGATDLVTFSETSYATPLATPEPSTLVFLGTGFAGAAVFLLRRRRARIV